MKNPIKMNKAEELAEKKYPVHSIRIVPARGGGYFADKHLREGFVEGYHQAEKDLTDKAKLSSGWDGFYYAQGYKQAKEELELTWEDIREIACLIDTVRAEVDDDYLLTLSIPKRIENEHREYKEILKRFKDFKGRKEL